MEIIILTSFVVALQMWNKIGHDEILIIKVKN